MLGKGGGEWVREGGSEERFFQAMGCLAWLHGM